MLSKQVAMYCGVRMDIPKDVCLLLMVNITPC